MGRIGQPTTEVRRREDALDARAQLPKSAPHYLSEWDLRALKQKEIGDIPVPPKYVSGDFQSSVYWRLRGKLDVPKERWLSFPHVASADGSPLLAWAGYDHLQRAKALSTFYVDVQERLGGRDDPRLLPLLACLIELPPWLKQWHNEVDPEYAMGMGDYFEGFVNEEVRQLGRTIEDIRRWQPPAKKIARKGATAPRKKEE